MSRDDPPLSMVALNLRVNLRNYCEFVSETLNVSEIVVPLSISATKPLTQPHLAPLEPTALKPQRYESPM